MIIDRNCYTKWYKKLILLVHTKTKTYKQKNNILYYLIKTYFILQNCLKWSYILCANHHGFILYFCTLYIWYKVLSTTFKSNNVLITISFIHEKIQICFPKNFNIYFTKCKKIYLFNSTALIADEDITRTRGWPGFTSIFKCLLHLGKIDLK